MQFDDFDKKIKEAAEHHHPAYEEKAWDQMEKLLDKHLPVEKDGRRRIIFLLLFLLLGGLGVYLGISKPWQLKKNITNSVVTPVNKKNDASSTTDLTKEKTIEPAGKTVVPEIKTTEPAEKNTNPVTNNEEKAESAVNTIPAPINLKGLKGKEPVSKELITAEDNNKKRSKTPDTNKGNVAFVTKSKKGLASSPVIKNQADHSVDAAGTQTIDNNTTVIQKTDDLITTPPAANNTITSPAAVNNDSVSKPRVSDIAKSTDEKKKDEAVKKQSPKPGKQRKSAFGITFTAGPDLSTVGLSDAGKVKLTYGAGLSYTLNRFTFRSGFYVAKKVYTAGPDDYHPPKHYFTYYVDLTKVDADCRIYEIPVTISYNFSEAKTHNWFASAGLSSYLMKREQYGYYYKDAAQIPRYKEWTLENGENHIFSILNLSAGYERKLNKTISIMAEPYFKVPLDGIGFGKIKLNSAGVLFTLLVKPFATKK